MTTRIMDDVVALRIPAELHKEIKAICAKRYKSVSAFLRDLAIDYLEDLEDTKYIKNIDIKKEKKGAISLNEYKKRYSKKV